MTALLSHVASQSISCCLRHRFIRALVGSWKQVIGECNRLPADSVNCPWRQRRGGRIKCGRFLGPFNFLTEFIRELIYCIMKHLRCLKSRGLYFPAIKCIVQKSSLVRMVLNFLININIWASWEHAKHHVLCPMRMKLWVWNVRIHSVSNYISYLLQSFTMQLIVLCRRDHNTGKKKLESRASEGT